MCCLESRSSFASLSPAGLGRAFGSGLVLVLVLPYGGIPSFHALDPAARA
jgi:hypothetical protein